MTVPAYKPGDVIEERFLVRNEIGRGGSAVIYEVFEKGREETVALKAVRKDTPDRVKALRREYVTLSRIDSRNVVKVYEVGETEEVAYYTMERIRGLPLFDFIADRFLTLKSSIELFRQLVYAVTALHMRGLVHRDLKPGNILVTGEGTVKLIDFELCQDSQAPDSLPDEVTGTVQWVSPEQAALFLGDRNPKTRRLARSPAADVYALGLILHYLLSRRHAHGEAGTAEPEQTEYLQRVKGRRFETAELADAELGKVAQAMLLPVAEGRPRRAGDVVERVEVACGKLTAEQGLSPLCQQMVEKLLEESRAVRYEDSTQRSRAELLRLKRRRRTERLGMLGAAVAVCFVAYFAGLARISTSSVEMGPGGTDVVRPAEVVDQTEGAYFSLTPESTAEPRIQALVLSVKLISGPALAGQKRYPCTRPEIAWKGACWHMAILEGKKREERVAACKKTDYWEPEPGWCEKTGGFVYVPVMGTDKAGAPAPAPSPTPAAAVQQGGVGTGAL